MRTRSPSCSARCWRCARAPVWSRSASSRSTARRSPRRRRITRRAAMSRSRARSSRRRPRVDAAEDELYGDARGDELPRGAAHERGPPAAVARGQAGAGCRARGGRRAGPARPRRAAAECRRRLAQDFELERRVIAEHAAWLAAGIASDGSRRMTGARQNIKPYPLIDLRRPHDQRHRSGLAQSQDDARVGAGLQRPGRRDRRADRDRGRDQHRVAGHRQPAPDDDGRRGRTACRRRRRDAGRGVGRRGLLEEQRDRGALRPGHPRRSSRPTPTVARNRGPAAAAAFMTSRGASWRPTGARSSTSAAKAASSPSSGRSRPTAAPTGSCAADDQRSDRNGGCSRRPTTCSSSTDTGSPPPKKGQRSAARIATRRAAHDGISTPRQRPSLLLTPNIFDDHPPRNAGAPSNPRLEPSRATAQHSPLRYAHHLDSHAGDARNVTGFKWRGVYLRQAVYDARTHEQVPRNRPEGPLYRPCD